MTEETQRLVREVVLTRHAASEAKRALDRAEREHEEACKRETAALEAFKKNGENGQFVFRGVLLKRWSGRNLQGEIQVDVRLEEASVVAESSVSRGFNPA